MLSKIDFEEHEATKKIIEEERIRLQMLEVSNKSITMSLNQFNQLPPRDINSICNGKINIPIEIKKHTEKKDSPMDTTCNPVADLEQTVKSHLPTVHKDSSRNDFFKGIHQDTINMVHQEEVFHTNRNMSVVNYIIVHME